jgi:hypothetical protein
LRRSSDIEQEVAAAISPWDEQQGDRADRQQVNPVGPKPQNDNLKTVKHAWPGSLVGMK